jgi:hypothetical protein
MYGMSIHLPFKGVYAISYSYVRCHTDERHVVCQNKNMGERLDVSKSLAGPMHPSPLVAPMLFIIIELPTRDKNVTVTTITATASRSTAPATSTATTYCTRATVAANISIGR